MTAGTARFCTRAHFDEWRRKQTDMNKLGGFTHIVEEFIQAVIPVRRPPGSRNHLRSHLAAFSIYLRARRLRSLAKVTPAVISGFLSDFKRGRPSSAAHVLADLRLLFDWLIVTGRRTKRNPVVAKLHAPMATKGLPRPYSDTVLDRIAAELKEFGDVRLQVAFFIGLEAGLQISEICELRLTDIDLERQTLRVRASNRTRAERYVYFHRSATTALKAWLKERPEVDHGYLLTARGGIPLRNSVLRSRFNRALAGVSECENTLSFRRLVQTAAIRMLSATDTMSVVAHFGWRSGRSIERLRKLPSAATLGDFVRAIEQAADEAPETSNRSESLDAYFGSCESQ